MTQPPHILIIGAGLLGLATARSFINRKAKVTLIERKTAIGHGAGFANSGMIHPSQAWPWVDGGLSDTAQLSAAQSVAQLAENAPMLLKQRMTALSLADINRADGCYQIFGHEAARNAAKTRYQQIKIRTDISELISHPTLYFPNDFSGNAYDWCCAEIQALVAEGIVLHCGANIALKQTSAGVTAILNGQNIAADHIILCMGHNTVQALEPLGLSLPMTAVRGFALDFNAAGLDLSDLPQAPIMDAVSRTALTRFGDIIRLSGTLGETSARPLWQRWYDITPNLMRALPRPHRVWSGNRPVSLLGRPVISETPLKGLWVNTGHGHMGWTLCLPSGKLIAEMILDGQTAPAFAWPSPED